MHRLPLTVAMCLTTLICMSVLVAGDSRGDPEAERTYAYGSKPGQRLVAYRDRSGPLGEGARRPGVVVLHGGFWFKRGSTGWKIWSRRIADSSFTVFDVDYRRNIDAPWPAQRSDVLRALRWIRQHADDFGVDPRRLTLLGSSAGGQLATNVGAYRAGRQHVAGVVALSPVVDPYRSWLKGIGRTGRISSGLAVLRSSAAVLAGCKPQRGTERDRVRCRRVWRDMSAVPHATGRDDAPMLLIHSRRDFVPVVHSDELRGAERRHGMAAGDISVMTVPGAGHGGALMQAPGVVPRVLDWIAERDP